MSIKITQPFSFEAQRPNFERDIINSSSFASGNPLVLTQNEINNLIGKYGSGHLVFDTNTEKYYSTRIDQTGLFSFVEVDTTLSGIAHSETTGDISAKEAVMPGFALSNGQVIILYLSTSSTVANATLNVNGTGAKQILIGGSATTATNLKSGYWLCEYVEDTQNNTSNWNCLKLTATSTREGFVKLGSDDVQQVLTAPATSVLNRTYPVQVNGDDQVVVNVPWKDVPREKHKLIYYTPDDPTGVAYNGLTTQQFMYEEGIIVDNAEDLAMCMQQWTDVDFTMSQVASTYVTELVSCNPHKNNSTSASDILQNSGLEAGAVASATVNNGFWGYDANTDSLTTYFNDNYGSRAAILYDPNNTDEYFVHDALYGYTERNGANDSIGLCFITFNNEVLTDGEVKDYGGVQVDESSYSKFTRLSVDLGCRSGRSFTIGVSQYKRKPDSMINGTQTSDYQSGYKSNAYWRNGTEDGPGTNLPQPYKSYYPTAMDGFGIVGTANDILPVCTTILPTNGFDGKTSGGTAGYIRCTTQRMNNVYKFALTKPAAFTYTQGYQQTYINNHTVDAEVDLDLNTYTISYRVYGSTDFTQVQIPVEKRHLFDEFKNNTVYYGFWQASTPEQGKIYNILYSRGSSLSNLILDVSTDTVYQNILGSYQQVSGVVPLNIMTGSHMNWNHITNKLWYSNGQEIYQIFPELYNDILAAQTQADWDASDSDDPSYIWNKPNLAHVATSGDYNDLENKPVIPVIPNHRTVNHEQMTESGGFDGNVNIHDGYYFPNSVQDNDGNWYGAVVIGDQVWMAENLRTTTYTDGVELDKSVDLSDQYAYFYPIDENNLEKGNFYNWYGAMYGQPSSGTTPSGVQGVSPAGWHIPSDEEFKLLVEYLGRQRRYAFNGDNDATAKSIASTTGWTHQQNVLPGWPSVDMEDNNATGFNAIPTGYILDSILIEMNTTRFWSSNCNENDDVFCAAIDGEGDGIITGYFTNKKALCAVRCLSDLNPVQFRDWYVNTYGTMQHHLANVQVQSNWNETNTSSPSYIINKPTIPAAQIQADWNQTNTSALDYIKNKPTISAALYEEIHYDDLVDLMLHNSLVKGKMYRITDYETTTTQIDTASAGHDFDVVVTAVSGNQLDPRALAVMRESDSYFYTAKSDLSKWLLLYDIKNDTTKYAWADDVNGKGVIYRMVDEFGNDCPYDFKNILFTKSPDYSAVYTFNYTKNGNNLDYSTRGSHCYDNTIKPYISSNSGYRLQTLNFNVFLQTSDKNVCFNNYLDNGCYDNSFGTRTNHVVFGRNCVGNTVSGGCQGIRLGDSCGYNTIDTGCTVVEFDFGCYNNILSMYCNNIDFGFSCHDNIINCSFCNNIRFENYNNFVRISNSETASDSNWLQNICVVQGFNDTNGPNYVDINTITRNRSYRTTVGLQTDGTVKIYNEEDPVTASSINSPLHIGPYNYDGSQEVTIGLYDGDGSDDYSVD